MNDKRMFMWIAGVLWLLGASLTSLRATDRQGEHNANDHETDSSATNAVYLELGGNTVFYSLNYDRMLTDHFSLRAGIEVMDKLNTLAVPLMINYLFGSGDHKFELGLGGVFFSESDAGLLRYRHLFTPGVTSYATATLAYRFHPKGGGLLFRIGFTPILAENHFIAPDVRSPIMPWIGISIGHAF